MTEENIVHWLLNGDVSLRFQTERDLLDHHIPELQKRIASEGWAKLLFSKRNQDGNWGQKFYQPKWTSTHYTLLDLRNLNVSPENHICQESVARIIKEEKGPDGGIRPIGTVQVSDVCINGMFLNYASYFRHEEQHLHSIIDFLLVQHMDDGGFNCRSNRSGAVHASMHSTLSVLEGISEYLRNDNVYKKRALLDAQSKAIEFLLQHQLFLSDRTGEIIHKDFLKLSYPSRWRYDILRALDYLQSISFQWDERLRPALDVLIDKRRKDGRWNVQAHHPGKVHVLMEKAGKASRWNTLRALRVLKHFSAY